MEEKWEMCAGRKSSSTSLVVFYYDIVAGGGTTKGCVFAVGAHTERPWCLVCFLLQVVNDGTGMRTSKDETDVTVTSP